MQRNPSNDDDGKLLTHISLHNTISNMPYSTASQYFDDCVPLELLNVDIRKNRARPPNQRPPSIDFLKRSKEITIEEEEIEVEVRLAAGRRLSFHKTDITITREPTLRRVETMISKKDTQNAPPWLVELKRKKMRSTENLETVGSGGNESETVSNPPEENKSDVQKQETKAVPEEQSGGVCKAKSDFSAISSLPAMKHPKSFSNSRLKKKPEVKPTLAELQKGAEKINNSIAELQRDIKILLEQIREMQTHSNVEQ